VKTHCSAFTLQTHGLCTKTTQIACFWDCSLRCIKKHVFGINYDHFACVQGYLHKTSQNVWKRAVLRLHSKHSVYAQKPRKSHVYIYCSLKCIRKQVFWRKYDHFVCVQGYMQKTHQTLSLSTKIRQIAYFWHCLLRCIKKHTFAMNYDHFVCVQGYLHKTSQNEWKHAVLRLHSKHSVYGQIRRKLHVFDIVH